MPNIKSAKKRVLVNQKKNLQNRTVLSEVKTAIKKFNHAIDTNQIEEAEKLLPITMSVIDSAASNGTIHKNNAANKKAALSKRLSDVKSGKVVVVLKKDNKTVAAEKAMAAKEAREAVRADNARKAAERAAQKEQEDAAAKKGSKTAKAVAKTEKKPAAKAAKAEKAEKAEKAPAKAEKAEKAEKAPAKAEKAPAKKPAAKKPAKTSEEKPE